MPLLNLWKFDINRLPLLCNVFSVSPKMREYREVGACVYTSGPFPWNSPSPEIRAPGLLLPEWRAKFWGLSTDWGVISSGPFSTWPSSPNQQSVSAMTAPVACLNSSCSLQSSSCPFDAKPTSVNFRTEQPRSIWGQRATPVSLRPESNFCSF